MRVKAILVFSLTAALPTLADSIPPPCSEEELLATSVAAVEGYVVDVACGDPRDSGQCRSTGGAGFLPELIADCTATVRITAVLLGSASPGDEVGIPFQRLVRECLDGEPMIPGLPTEDFRLGAKVRHFDSPSCAWSSLVEIQPPFLRGDADEDGAIDLTDAVAILQALFLGGRWPAVPEAADANGTGETDIGDPIYLLFYLFAGGPPPPDPFPRRPEATIAIAYDNNPSVPGLEADWGFSCLIDTGREQVLLDAGPSGPGLLANLGKLGIDPAGIDRVVFSHIHNDHIAGAADVFGALLQEGNRAPAYIPKSFPASFRGTIAPLAKELIDVTDGMEISPGIFSTGEMAGSPKEQSLFFSSQAGLVLIVACAHQGIVPAVERAALLGGGPVDLLLGGLHLFQSSDAEIQAAIDDLRSHGVRRVAPCHCTGDRAKELLRAEYRTDFIEIGGGARIPVRR